MNQRLANKFSAHAEQSERAFPEQLRNFVLVSDNKETPIYVSPEIAEDLNENIDRVKKLITSVKNTLHTKNAAGIAYRSHTIAGIQTALIGLRDKPPGFFTKKYTQNMRAHYVLDHEIGHRVVPKGFAGGHLGECAADAYAALCHIQNYGRNTDFFKNVSKAYTIVLGGSPIHYTQAIFDAVQEYAEQHDVSKLTPEETAGFADTIATKHHLKSRVLNKIALAFSPVHMITREKIGDKTTTNQRFYARDHDAYTLFCQETFKVMQAHSMDADIVKTGKEFLQAPPIKSFILSQAKKDQSWQDIADFINTGTIAQTHKTTAPKPKKARPQI